jgi:hypothetical protein
VGSSALGTLSRIGSWYGVCPTTGGGCLVGPAEPSALLAPGCVSWDMGLEGGSRWVGAFGSAGGSWRLTGSTPPPPHTHIVPRPHCHDQRSAVPVTPLITLPWVVLLCVGQDDLAGVCACSALARQLRPRIACVLSFSNPSPLPGLPSASALLAVVQRSSDAPGANASQIMAANVEQVVGWVAKAASAGAEVVLFPELTLGLDCSSRPAATGYSFWLGHANGQGACYVLSIAAT